MLTKESLRFLEDLKNNNSREWFLANKKRYEAYKKDYLSLAAEFLNLLKPLDPSLNMLEAKNCIFRINRDIRFSKDKSPYKTNMGLWFSCGVKRQNRAGYYVHIEHGSSFVAGGLYCPEVDELKKVRKEIAFFNDDLQEVLTDKKFVDVYGDMDITAENSLKNPPKGYEKDHEAIKYLKLKSYSALHKFDINKVLEKDFVPSATKKLIALKPMNDFINRALESE